MSLKKRINELYSQIIGVETIRFEIETDDNIKKKEELEEKYKHISNPHIIIFRL